MTPEAIAFHYLDINATLLDFIVVDPTARQRGIGGALYEALREYVARIGSSGLYLEVRPDAPELEPEAARTALASDSMNATARA